MAFISSDELKTHLYSENITAIQGDDETILTAAIDGACQQAKSYLNAFDTDAVFGATGNNRNALLLIFIKDMAVWHFIKLCNAGTSVSFRRDNYTDAVDWLKNVQKGNTIPDFPLRKDESGKPETNTLFKIGSNPKRGQHI